MNDKSCLVDAAAHTLSLSVFGNPDIPQTSYQSVFNLWKGFLVGAIGHDGSERGFHTQELQDALREAGVLMQRHEVYPCLQLPPGKDDPVRIRVIPIYNKANVPEIFLPKLNQNNGVLIVKHPSGIHHALSFTAGSNTAYDVAKQHFTALEDLDIVMFLEFIGHEINSTL